MEEYFNKIIDIYLFVIEYAHYLPAIFLICTIIVLIVAGLACMICIIWSVTTLIIEHRREVKARKIQEDKEIDDDIRTILNKIQTKEP